MIKTVIALIIITIAVAGPADADEIFLTGGDSTLTSILDIAGMMCGKGNCFQERIE